VKRLLITCFEPFDGESINSSTEAARAMESVVFPGADLRVALLPVERFKATEAALGHLREYDPDLVIMLGESGGRYRINPERIAINVDDFRIPDNAGNKPVDQTIIEGGPTAYFTTLPIRAIRDRLVKARIPAAISNSAGTYLCNRLFYSVMHEIATANLAALAGFIHLPYLHDQVLEKRHEFPSFSRETIVEGARLAVEVSLAHALQRGSSEETGHAV
jgi:pyroglutamyl-peptidase